MKNSMLLRFILLFTIMFTHNLFATSSECDFYNQEYDKYSQLAENAPNASVKKLELIRKVDFYDTQIFNDLTCDLQKARGFKDTDIINNLLDGI